MLKLNTDFEDFYDAELSSLSGIEYNRFKGSTVSRGEELNWLNRIGIKTVKFGAASSFIPATKQVVVYTNPFLHDFKGKSIYNFDEYRGSNYLIAEFLADSLGYTVKYLQVGERRFKLMLYNKDFRTKLSEGVLVSCEELPKQYNYSMGIPIYSIDYVSNGHEMLAVDFNRVQNLKKLGMENVMKASEVALEVRKALIEYNKA